MGFLYSLLFIILSITFFQSEIQVPVIAAKDILYPGDELITSTLVSANMEFTLGFFTNLSSSNNFSYLGIWYTNDDVLTLTVWVANRDMPMIGSGVLMIDDSGTLKIFNGNGTTFFTIFNNQVGTGNKNTRAVLEDSGNFILYDENNQILWQSFDHPIDLLIPGMKIGYNLTTKQNWTLTSWLSDQVPASGAFTMRLEQYQNSTQLRTYRRGELYWATCLDNPDFIGSEIQYQLISDHAGMYLMVQNLGPGSSALQLSPYGDFGDSVNMSSFSPHICYGEYMPEGCGCVASAIDSVNMLSNSPHICYGEYMPEGCRCVASAMPNYCRTHDYSLRLECSGAEWVGAANYDNNSSINLSDCMERCLNNCNCTGFTTFNRDGTGCTTYTGNVTAYLKPGESDQTQQKCFFVSDEPYDYKPPKRKISNWVWIWIGIGIFISRVGVVASFLAAYLCYLCYVWIQKRILKEKEKRRRDHFIHQLTGSDSFNYGDELEKDIKDAPDIKIFSFKAILTATNNFSDENKLGRGGYGPVYKGKLFDGREIAVKRLSKTSGQGIQEFKSELILISKLNHTNLVRLYGCCIYQEEKMLIYEFMPNKSMDFFLFVEDKKENLDWKTRFNIIDGIAQGLLYLHKYSRLKIIHRDLKVSNILLDGNMNPKIADFGMARIFKQDVTEAVTNRLMGTYGYMAPEYAMEGTFSFKTDVFSFGVLILEIISGKRNSSFNYLGRPFNLVGYVWDLWNGQAALELKDKALGESFDVKQLLRAIHVGLLCVQENADDRPTISKVIYWLNNETADLPRPKQPAFFTDRQTVETRPTDHLLDLNTNVPVSKNSLTITLEGR